MNDSPIKCNRKLRIFCYIHFIMKINIIVFIISKPKQKIIFRFAIRFQSILNHIDLLFIYFRYYYSLLILIKYHFIMIWNDFFFFISNAAWGHQSTTTNKVILFCFHFERSHYYAHAQQVFNFEFLLASPFSFPFFFFFIRFPSFPFCIRPCTHLSVCHQSIPIESEAIQCAMRAEEAAKKKNDE